MEVDKTLEFAEQLGRALRLSDRSERYTVAVSSDDTQLVANARAGDRVAFGFLYDRYARMVHGILLARVPREVVDDLVQDVFLLALRHIVTLRDLAAFGGWLAMIARNRAKDHFRRSPHLLETPLQEDPDAREIQRPGPNAEALAALSAIRDLPDAYRETLILRLVEGLTGPEIAHRTGMTPGSVRVNLFRGMQLLRSKLGKEERP